MCTRAHGLFAHATTPGASTTVVTQAKRERYKNICASGPPERAHAARGLTHPTCMLAFNTAALLLTNRTIRKSLQGVRPQPCAAFLVAALQVRQGFSERLRPSLRCDCCAPRLLGTDSSSRMCIVHEGHLGIFQNLNREFPAHGRKIIQEDFQRIACFQVLEDDADGHSGANENRRSAKDLRV